MGFMEIFLIIVGVIVLVLSYVLPMKEKEKRTEQAPKVDEGMIKELIEKEIKDEKNRINDVLDETITYSMEKTERAMERLTNEKMMAVNEYSDQVLEAINKNHQEVIFLYDMLNDKHENLVSTVSEASKKAQEIKQTVQDAEITVKEAVATGADKQEDKSSPKQAVDSSTAEKIPEEKVSEEKQKAEKTTGKKTRGTKSQTSKKADVETSEGEEKTDSQSPDKVTSKKKTRSRKNEIETKTDAVKDAEAEFIPISPEVVRVENGMIVEEPESIWESMIAGNAENNPTADSITPQEEPVNPEIGHNNNETILRLHKLGQSQTAIAKELGLGVGEVKLVIDLFEKS